MRNHRPESKVQLCAVSQEDTATSRTIIDNAGKDGYLTVTTQMLGRGTDFKTKHQEGFLGINICTDITYSAKMQIYAELPDKLIREKLFPCLIKSNW